MSSFVPGHFDDYPPPMGEEPSHPEHPQDQGQTDFVFSEVLQVAVNNTMPDPLDDTLPALGEEPNHPEHTQDPGETHLSGVQQVVITAIRATDLTLGLRRIPAGFHVVVKAGGAECQTSNKFVHVDQAVIEWNEHIFLPCESSSKVRVNVYASFELGPMLSHGELLRTFEISVGELLDRSEKSHPMIFQPKQQEVASPCTSLLMTVEQRLSDAAVLCPLTTLTSSDVDALILRTEAGHGLLARYCRTQNSRDLDQSIEHFERACDLCPMDHPCRPAALFNLATAKFVSCKANRTYLDLDTPITLFEDTLDLRPTGHPDRTVTQLHLAISLLCRFAKRGYQTDADEAEKLLGKVLDVCHANSHIHRAALLAIETFALHSAESNDASHLRQQRPTASMLPSSPDQLLNLAKRCLQKDDPHALDEVICLHSSALGYYNTMHAGRGQLVCNLSVMLITRFERRGNDEDLDQALALQREHLALCPVGHTDRFTSLNNLANVLSTRFYHRGDDGDLDEAIALEREALALDPVGHTDRSMALNNLGNQLSARFEHRGNVGDLEQAIALHREALALDPVGRTDRSKSLNNLATQLSVRFDHRGNDGDLDEAIAFHREALTLQPVGHTERSLSLNNLATQLFIRFDYRGNDGDLDEAIALQREDLALCPVGHIGRSASLNNLGNHLSARFRHRGNDEDLDEAVALQREALALRPVGHTDRSKLLNNLANQLSTRFRHRGNDGDLDEAIALHREALALSPVGHTDRFMSLQNLANQLSTRFDQRRNREDLDESISRSLPVHLSLYHPGLDGTSPGEDIDSLNVAMHHLKAAANVVSAGFRPRLKASLRWVHCASQYSHSTELEAYATSMQLLDITLVTSVALLNCWNKAGLLSGPRWHDSACPLDSLQTRGDHAVTLMKRFRDLSSLLDKPPASNAEGTPRVDIEAEEMRYRRLVEDWSRAVEEIREIEGFSRFLLPLSFSDLQDAACDGPIIVLVASLSSCDAIIIPHKQPPTSIQLPTTFQKLLTLVPALHRARNQGASPKGNQPALTKALRELWDDVVCPVVEKLRDLHHKIPGYGGAQRPSSISFPCTLLASTGNMDGLAEAISGPCQCPLLPLVRISQPVIHSLWMVWSLSWNWCGVFYPPSPTVSFTKLTSADATKSRALHTLRDNTWLHFACHGTQKHQEPFKSAFLMRDQPLSLLDITQMDLSRHEFAFLSACETAVGDFASPDEVVHLAAGLQFAGVKSVVGTLWKVNDATVQRLVEAFYKNLCGDGKMNCKRAARALHQAVQSLACDKDIPLDQRIVFMHIGV
ncbi:CHAT domain-containing protein [Suillus lakei]|nr:CHAT domain-containing protein [Suillus lakei]